VRAERLPPALAHGATRAVLAGGLADSEVFDAFIDASGAERAVISGIEHLAPRGRAVLVGMGAETVAIPVAVLQSREIIVTGTFRYANTWRTAVALAASGAIDLDLLVTSHHDLTDVRGALEAGATPGALKAVVHPTR
jgi:L-iditol 2-dehydrogenase